MTFLQKIHRFVSRSSAQTSDFSDFFYDASPAEKKERILKAVREANEDQRLMVEKYRKMQNKTAS